MTKQDSVRDTSAPGLNPVKRDAIGTAMRVLTKITGSELAEKYNLRQTIDRGIYESTKTGFKTLGAATRTFEKVAGGGKPERLPDATGARKDYFDLTPDDEQKMIVETVQEFAEEIMRPAAHDADEAAESPADLGRRAAELGITFDQRARTARGCRQRTRRRHQLTCCRSTRVRRHGSRTPDSRAERCRGGSHSMGNRRQQKTYLPAFTGETVPGASVVINEPRALFDPFALQTKAVRSPSGYKLNGVKSLVPAAAVGRAVRHRRRTRRQAVLLHRRVRYQRTCRGGGSQHGPARSGPRPIAPDGRRGARIRTARRR